jgi:transcriptional repressor of cell division inhibition gene dicB
MLKSDVLKHFDAEDRSLQATATALGITKSAVSQWGEVIPAGVAYKLQVMTAGVLRVDPSLYAKEQADPPEAA